jgi:hypothetical protein
MGHIVGNGGFASIRTLFYWFDRNLQGRLTVQYENIRQKELKEIRDFFHFPCTSRALQMFQPDR